MELTLVTRSITINTVESTQQLVIGQEIEYYGMGNDWIGNPSTGIIQFSKEDGWFILWDDSEFNTILDDSEKSNEILRNCGFTKT